MEQKRDKHVLIIVVACILIIASVFAICIRHFRVEDDSFTIKAGEYLAGGTIPSGAKIYPIVNEGLSMSLNDVNGVLDDEDIFTLTKYVDQWCTANDTRGEGFLEEEVSKFSNTTSINEIKESITNHNFDYKVEGTQILTMSVDKDGIVEIPYIMTLTGKNDAAGYPEGSYECIAGLFFKEVNNNWYECGIGFIAFGEKGAFEYKRDEITGLYSIDVVGNVLSSAQN